VAASLRDSENRGNAAVSVSERLTHTKNHSLGVNGIDWRLMSDRETAIRASQLSKDFGCRCVLRQIDLEITTGESVALTGANGAGKTTLLRCLASAIRPTTGEISWFGQTVTSRPAVRRWVGMVAHDSRLYPHLSLRENLIFAARMCGVSQPGPRADMLLEQIELDPYADDFPTHVSKGMRQRVDIARALVHDPPVLLLDEPLAGLDTRGTQWLMSMLLDLRRNGRTICFVSHDEATTDRLADRRIRLQSGGIHDPARRCDTKGNEILAGSRAA